MSGSPVTEIGQAALAPVLHVAIAGWLLQDEPSGATRRQLSLLRAAAGHLLEGERMTVLCGLDAPELSTAPGVDVRRVAIPAEPTWRRALAERRVLPDALRAIGATVLDLGSLPVPSSLPCPVTLTIHDLRDLTEFRRRPRLLARTTLRRSAVRVQHLVVPSAFTAQALDRALPRGHAPITVVPGGVDEAFFRRVLKEPERAYFLHVGHLERRKNLDMLLRAFARFGRDMPTEDGPLLLLVGQDTGAGRQLQRRAQALGIDDRVRFCGGVDEEELRDLYGQATAVLLPSLYEGFGLPALEALAMGQTLLVSDRGALPELVGDAARIVRADAPDAWAEALREVWHRREDHAAAGAAEQSRRLQARTFRWDDAGARLLQVWRRTQLASSIAR